ncbi:hypothetical protein FCY92_25740 [Escherichia coli]|nr:hypothetical protein [Escherichia coli]
MGSCAAPSAKGDDKFITTDYLQQCPCDYLSREFSSRRQFFDDAPTEIISRSWKRLVINKEKHITRRGYTLCFLSKLQDSLRGTVANSRW